MQLLDLGQIKIKLRTVAVVVEGYEITKVSHLVKEGGTSQNRSKIVTAGVVRDSVGSGFV